MSRSLVWVTRPNCGKTAPGWCLLDLFRWDGLHFFNRICLSQSRFWFFLTDKNRPTREQKQWEVDDKVSLGNISFWIVTLRHELWPFLNWFQLLKVTNCRHLNMYYLLEIFPLKPKIFVTNIIPSEVSVDLVQSAVNTSSPSASQAWPWLWFGFLSTSKPLRWLPSGGWQSKILDRTPARWVNSERSYIENMANLAKLPQLYVTNLWSFPLCGKELLSGGGGHWGPDCGSPFPAGFRWGLRWNKHGWFFL